MRLACGCLLILLSTPIEALEPCVGDGIHYVVNKSIEFRPEEPEPDLPLVRLSTEYGFVLLAEQSKFVPLADYRVNRRKGLGPYDFYWWLRSRQPTNVIDLDQFENPYSHKYFYMMKLVEGGEFYVQAAVQGSYLKSVHLEWYGCKSGDSGITGGRRLRTESGKTIYWNSDWVF